MTEDTPATAPVTEPPYEWEGRIAYSAYRRYYGMRQDWADLPEEERQEFRDDARKKAERREERAAQRASEIESAGGPAQ